MDHPHHPHHHRRRRRRRLYCCRCRLPRCRYRRQLSSFKVKFFQILHPEHHLLDFELKQINVFDDDDVTVVVLAAMMIMIDSCFVVYMM
jgi:hypothetical protein